MNIHKQKRKLKLTQLEVQRAQRERKIGTIKINKKKMANTVPYPDLALEKITGIDSSEDPTAFIRFLEKKISLSSGSIPTTNGNNVQTVYDDRRKAIFGSVIHGRAAEWFILLEVASA